MSASKPKPSKRPLPGAEKGPVHNQKQAPDRAEDSTRPAKRVKISDLTLEKFGGDVSAWFQALQDFAEPGLSKIERDVLTGKQVRMETGKAWDVIRKSAKAPVPEKGEGPAALVVSASADRSCVVAKDFKKFPGALAKLFARHMKIPEQAEFLKDHTVGPAVGTPNRLLKLCEEGNLKLDKLKYLIVDMFVDSKSYTVLTMPEVSRDFFVFYRKFVATLPQDVEIVLLNPGEAKQGESEQNRPKSNKKKQKKPKIKKSKPEETESNGSEKKDA